MKILAVIAPLAQKDVIEKILRALDERGPLGSGPAGRSAPELDGAGPTTEAAWINPPPMDGQHFEDWSGGIERPGATRREQTLPKARGLKRA